MPMQMTGERAVSILRNALIASGEEMGREGDHWPAIKSTVYHMAKDWEDLQVERNVFAELKTHFGDIITRMEKDLEICPADIRPQIEKLVKDAREAYAACFTETDMTMYVVCDEDIPIHIKRADQIMKVLEDDNG